MKKFQIKNFYIFNFFFFHYINKFVKKLEGGSTKALNFLENLKNLLFKKSIGQKFFEKFFNYKLLIIY